MCHRLQGRMCVGEEFTYHNDFDDSLFGTKIRFTEINFLDDYFCLCFFAKLKFLFKLRNIVENSWQFLLCEMYFHP